MANIARASESDIDYLRKLAESGANAPLLSGRYLAWWGLLVAIAYALQHFALNGRLGDPEKVGGMTWMGFMLVGVAGQFVLVRAMRAKAGSGSAAKPVCEATTTPTTTAQVRSRLKTLTGRWQDRRRRRI